MSTWAFVQARVGSSRLPGKVLADVAGKPLIQRVLERARSSNAIDSVAVLVPDTSPNRPLGQLCEQLGYVVVAGSEHDALERFRRAAERLAPDVVVRLTGDNPLLDPRVVDDLIRLFRSRPKAAYGAVACGPLIPSESRFPHGLDAEVLPRSVLDDVARRATDPYERQHVTAYVWRRPEVYPSVLLEAPGDWPNERWTVDEAADLEFVRGVYRRLGPEDTFGWREVLDVAPEVRANAAARISSPTARRT
jgi:spore coat polysaccharide biosynthesis protein SpsF (cytidylyltransferase family)